ncbi:LuxR C-terminal-related transcriptional regulator [uncultured Microbacterium sp.]|uniref:LuxR C-terminal-related transcriptional regulator n=1 Tax=uncultured Microbacterium sp. TaxID=191216 RepID=UPI0035C95438
MTAPTIFPVATTSHAPMLTRVAGIHLATMAAGDAPYRAVVLGPAGAGKSRLMRQLRHTLAHAGREFVVVGARDRIEALPADSVALIDDAHLLSSDRLAQIAARIADPEAMIVLAARPWPQDAALTAIVDALEHTQPAILLGHLSRADVGRVLAETGPLPACVDAILHLTGGISWLVGECLAIHDASGCADDHAHTGLLDGLQDVIAHRLATVDPAVRDLVHDRCLALDDVTQGPSPEEEELLVAGHVEGLLLRNGRPVPAVRHAVRAAVPAERLVALYLARSSEPAEATALREMLGGLRDPRVAVALLNEGDALAVRDSRRAEDLYRLAAEAGADAAAVAIRIAELSWARGEVDAAGNLLDGAHMEHDHPDRDRAADTAAAIWAARGLMTMSDTVYRSVVPDSPHTRARAAMAALAVADPERLIEAAPPAAQTMPSTLGVAMELLTRGLRDSVDGPAQSALTDLVRASEMYSASAAAGPSPELPAVIAAIAAINLGELDVASSVLDTALQDRHGWAHDRLLLWRTWVALQQEHAHDVESAVQSIAPVSRSLSPRDRLLFDAISLAIARRYHDATAVIGAWRGARESLLRARFDVFSHLPLGEFVLTAARVGQSDRMRPHFDGALAQIARLGSPPLWSAHPHWTGIQQAILLGRPGDLAPHARALVDAAPHNPLAAMMAQAGRVWTSVLAGTVNADVVEKAALGLATVGLAWDGARLAGHGAGRTQDRRTISRLLACARRLHPREELRPATLEEDTVSAPAKPRSYDDLSPREREVAALVIEGKTYAEIGTAIFISPRTAEHHIARIRRRLGATTRSDLISKLRAVIDDETAEGAAAAASDRESA